MKSMIPVRCLQSLQPASNEDVLGQGPLEFFYHENNFYAKKMSLKFYILPAGKSEGLTL